MKKILLIISLLASVFCFAQPTITTFSPSSGAIGSSVTITGTNFNTTANQNIVFFGATQATVTAASATSLTVTVPLGATYQYLSVTNLATNLTAYSASPFNVTFAGNVSFSTKVDFTTGTSPFSVSIGDLDGDAKADLAVTNSGSNSVSVFRNVSTLGVTSFSAKVDFNTGNNPQSVSIGDIDGDGKPDLAVANKGSNNVSVLLNVSTVGVTSFSAKVDYVTGSSPRSVCIGDIDGDGKADLAVASGIGVSVLRNVSTLGVTSFSTQVTFPAGANTYSVNIGDIDGDGKVDLVAANVSSNTVSVLRNVSTLGVTSFSAKVDFTTNLRPYSVSICDIDGDGKLDLATANYGLNVNSVSVLRNVSTVGVTSFSTKQDFPTGSYPRSVSIGDIDGDGKVDLAVANEGSNTVSVLRNVSTVSVTSFSTKVDFATGSAPYSASIGDIDGDGKPDLAVANYLDNTVSVLRQIVPPPTITSYTPTSGCANTASVVITGTNLTGASSVSIGGTNVQSFTVNSATQITAAIGNGTTGVIEVTTLGGTATSVTTFTINPLPVLTLSASTTSYCVGSGAISTLTATGANTYTWSPATALSATTGSSVTANPTSTITYTVNGADGFGCVDSKSSIITVNPLPVVTAVSSLTTVCKDAFVNLSGSGASSYTWSGGVTNGVSFAPTATQTYTVTGTNANGCVNTSEITIVVDLCTGIETIQNNSVSIFPNPTNGLITITAESKIEAVEITNLLGEKIYSSTINLDTYTIDLSKQAVGVYSIFIKTENGFVNKKIVLNK